MSQKILLINFERHLHGFFTGIENVYFKSPSDLKTTAKQPHIIVQRFMGHPVVTYIYI